MENKNLAQNVREKTVDKIIETFSKNLREHLFS